MKKLTIPKLDLLYTKEEIVSLINTLFCSDSKKESNEAREKIDKHVYQFCSQMITWCEKISSHLNCFRTTYKFIFRNIKLYELTDISNWNLVYAYKELRYISQDKRSKLIINIDNLTDVDFLIKFCNEAKTNAIDELDKSIEYCNNEITRFSNEKDTLNELF